MCSMIIDLPPNKVVVLPLLLLLIAVFSFGTTECPRKTEGFQQQRQQVINEDEGATAGGKEHHAPGIEPAKQFIQTTFIHRDNTDEEREFAQFVRLRLSELRPRLRARAHVSLDNENVECIGAADQIGRQHHRCREYPLGESFHFLVVEDSRVGAAVYSITQARNWDAGGNRARTMARVEAALLDALSRHSVHPLTPYASEAAANELGFVREVGVAELEQYIRQNHAALVITAGQSAPSPRQQQQSIYTRSPTELWLLNERLLAHRRVDFDPAAIGGALLQFQGPELAELIDAAEGVRAVFVLFWSEASPLSAHALRLWAAASELWQKEGRYGDATADDGTVVLGAVACHEEEELCRAFAVSPMATLNQQQLFAFRRGQRVAQQPGMGDAQFLVQWIRMVLAGPLIRLADAEAVRKAEKEGLLPGFRTPVAALTVGRFRSEQQEEFRKFARAATILHGRYHLAYSVDERTDAASLSTFRRTTGTASGQHDDDDKLELVAVPFVGAQYDTRALLHHITHASVPNMLDIGRGFTADIVLRSSSSRRFLLFIDDSSRNTSPLQAIRHWFHEAKDALGQSSKKASIHILTVDAANALPLGNLLEALGIASGGDGSPPTALCLLAKKEIGCALGVAEVGALTRQIAAGEVADQLLSADHNASSWGDQFHYKVPLDPVERAHPLAQIQLQHVNALFGEQYIQLQPAVFRSAEQEDDDDASADPHDFATMDPAAVQGCPMMAHLNGGQQQLKDEL